MISFPDTGKIQNDFYKEMIFPFCGAPREEVVVGPQYGVDVSIIDLKNGLALALTSDPLSLIPTLGLQESAWLSVQLMANDMATTGLSPTFAQFVLTLPQSLTTTDFAIYWRYIHDYCEKLGIAITGGHTGKFAGINSTVVGGGTMAAVGPLSSILTSRGAMPGDIIIMTKEAALIATAVLALSFPVHLENHAGKEILNNSCELFYETTALEAGLIAGRLNKNGPVVTAMHDVTEGGVLGAVCELSMASGCGATIMVNDIPVGECQKAVCGLFNIDPYFTLGAGSMLMTVIPEKASFVIEQLQHNGINATAIGKVTTQSCTLIDEGVEKPLRHPGVDPYWKAFFNAFENGIK